MASAFHNLSYSRPHKTNAKPSVSSSRDRRQFLFLTSGAAATFAAGQLSAKAEDIGFFGIRKKVEEVEKEAEEIMEKGVEAAEKGVEAVEKGIVAAEEEIESMTSFGAVAQAGVVAGAEVLGVLVATSVVKRILDSEA
ncbi:hypothetical protein QQ045_011511 [Rhodiola kirilowii]